MAGDYADKVVVITGASSGIGAALAEEIARRGGRVVLAARRREKLAEVAGRCKSETLIAEADVTRRPDVQRILDQAVVRFGRVDIWINNAGRGISRSLEQLTDEDVDTMMRDNLKSALYGMQVALAHMKSQGAGAIVNVSSLLARTPFAPFRSAYSASKAALNSLSETLRIELAQKHPGIRVVTAMPGAVATDFGNNAIGGGPDSRTIPGAQTVEDVARAIADGALARNGDVYTRPDSTDRVLGYLHALTR